MTTSPLLSGLRARPVNSYTHPKFRSVDPGYNGKNYSFTETTPNQIVGYQREGRKDSRLCLKERMSDEMLERFCDDLNEPGRERIKEDLEALKDRVLDLLTRYSRNFPEYSWFPDENVFRIGGGSLVVDEMIDCVGRFYQERVMGEMVPYGRVQPDFVATKGQVVLDFKNQLKSPNATRELKELLRDGEVMLNVPDERVRSGPGLLATRAELYSQGSGDEHFGCPEFVIYWSLTVLLILAYCKERRCWFMDEPQYNFHQPEPGSTEMASEWLQYTPDTPEERRGWFHETLPFDKPDPCWMERILCCMLVTYRDIAGEKSQLRLQGTFPRLAAWKVSDFADPGPPTINALGAPLESQLLRTRASARRIAIIAEANEDGEGPGVSEHAPPSPAGQAFGSSSVSTVASPSGRPRQLFYRKLNVGSTDNTNDEDSTVVHFEDGVLAKLRGDTITLGKVIGEGTHGVVYAASCKTVKIPLAVKINYNNKKEVLRNEYMTYSSLGPEAWNVIVPAFKGFGLTEDGAEVLVTELIEEGQFTRPVLPSNWVLGERYGLMKVIREFHRRGFVHNDLDLRNILWTQDNHPLLIDLALASRHQCDHDRCPEVQVWKRELGMKTSFMYTMLTS